MNTTKRRSFLCLLMLAGTMTVSAAPKPATPPKAPTHPVLQKSSLSARPIQKRVAVANLVASVHKVASASSATHVVIKRSIEYGFVILYPGTSVEIAMLESVYRTLSLTDNDYRGHRKHALKDVATAGRNFKTHLHGDVESGGRQFVPDSQIRDAQRLLGRVGASAAARGNVKALSAIRSAIEQIDLALAPST